MAFPIWPYSNLHDLNLDWILSKISTVESSRDAAIASAKAAKDSEDAAKASEDNAALSEVNAADSASGAALSANTARYYAEHIGDSVSGIVADWLDLHVDPDTGYVIDNTLTIPGAAADAYTTGLAVAEAANVAPTLAGGLEPRYIEVVIQDSDYAQGALNSVTPGNAITFGSQSSYKHVKVPVTPGTDYQVQTTFNSTTVKYFGFVDGSDVVVEAGPLYTGSGEANEYTTLTCPDGASFLYVATYGSLSSQNRVFVYAPRPRTIGSTINMLEGAEFIHDVPFAAGTFVQGIMNTSTGGINASNTLYAHTSIFTLYGPAFVYFKPGSDLQYETLIFAANEYNNGSSASTTNFVGNLKPYGDGYFIIAESYPAYVMLAIRKGYPIQSADLADYNSDIFIRSTVPAPAIADISMFEKWAVTGCSWDAGSVYKDDSLPTHVTHTGLGWAENLARQSGTEVSNFAIGGTNIKSWFNWADNDGYGMKGLLSTPALPLYWLIEGNSNDAAFFDDATKIGTITDITDYNDYTQYPSTFYGIMGRVIEMIMEHAPDSKIIVTSPDTGRAVPGNASRWALESAVEEIALYYNLPYADIKTDPFYPYYVDALTKVHNHPTAVLYSGAAKMYNRMFDKVCKNRYDYFADYTGVIQTVPVTWTPIN